MLASILLFTLLSLSIADQLVQVQVVHRHGDRAPVSGAGSSPQARDYFYRGHGHLTNAGLLQASELGKVLRARYVDTGFLDARMKPTEISIRSSPVERCLQTATMLGIAMFNQTEDGLPSVPPVHSQDKEHDKILYHGMGLCPGLMKEQEERFGLSNGWQLVEVFNANASNPVPKDKVKDIELYYVEKMHPSLPLPEWYTEEMAETVKFLIYKYMAFLVGAREYHNPRWLRATTGLLLDNILSSFSLASDCDTKKNPGCDTKMRVWSTHDLLLVSLADSLGIYEQCFGDHLPDYASSITLEMWRGDHGDTVKIFCRGVSGPMTGVTPRDCSVECPRERFEYNNREYRSSDNTEYCFGKKEEGGQQMTTAAWVLLGVSLLALALLLLSLLALVFARRSLNKHTISDESLPRY